jgi:MFS family permease
MSSTPSSATTYEPPPNGWRTFLVVWSTQSISLVGSALTIFANTVWLTQTLYPRPEQKPELALALSALSLVFGVPVILLAPIAGAWADRHDRKRTMIVADTLSGCLTLLLAVLMATHLLQLWSLLIIEFFYALSGAFHGAAFDTSYAMLVPEKQLPRANGMMQTIWSLSGIISPGVAAFLISLPALARSDLVPGPLD